MRNRLCRVAVVGSSCSGKTTFARCLSQRLCVSHIELDALYWGPNWTPRPPLEFRGRVEAAVAAPAWVSDGNYSLVRDLVWCRAGVLIWLNYPFSLVFPRAVRRTLRRIRSREEIYGGNRESLRSILDPEWIPWWVVRTFWKRRREYPVLFGRVEYRHLRIIEFKRPAQAERFLSECTTDSGE